MNKIIILMLLSIVLIAGCGDQSTKIVDGRFGGYTAITTDKTTGCKYFKQQGWIGSPVYDKDGKVEGCGNILTEGAEIHASK